MEQQKDQVHLAVPGGEAKSLPPPSVHRPERDERESFEHYKDRRALSHKTVRRITHPVNLGGPRDFRLHQAAGDAEHASLASEQAERPVVGAVSTEQERPTGFYAPDPMPRWKRWLQQTLFPQAALLPDDDEIPGFAPGEIFTGVVVSASWADRLRLLVSGRMTIDTRHRADVHVSRVTSRSMFNVAPPTFLQ